MMKKNLLSLLTILLSLAATAQSTFTNTNEPAIGDTRTYNLCDSFATNYENITGNGVTWNYGVTSTYAGETRTLNIVDPTTTAYSADFPGATSTLVIEDFLSSYTSSDALGRISQGYLIESVDLGIVKAKFTNDPENLMTYPFALSNEVNDVFSGNLSFTYNSIPQNPTCSGVSKSTYDGYGTLIQTNNIALSNIARFHIIDTTSAIIPIIGSTKLVRNQFEYYDLSSSNKTPVFVHSNVKVVSGFPEPLVNINIVLSAASGNGLASVKETNSKPVVIYPNPAKDLVTIGNLNTEAIVSIVDLSGRVQVLPRSNSNQFDISRYAAGVYQLQISNNGQVSSERLIIK